MIMSDSQQRREAIYIALSQVPKGRVITYGNLAKLAGLPKGARIAGKILGDLPQASGLPWHRVVNAQGKISFPADSTAYRIQISLLEDEGIEFINGKIRLKLYSYSS